MTLHTHSLRPVHWAQRRVVVATVVLVAVFLLMRSMVLPLSTTSYQLVVPTGALGMASVQWTASLPTQVTVHFDMRNALAMSFWVRGPGAMTGSDVHSMGMSGASYSFWSWGGVYQLGAGSPVRTCGYPCYQPSSSPVWVNVTTGLA
ncbi:MAG: hypothetical protein ACHQ2Y_08885 [Candidatus Lutacidiplasmatales archaeon]